MSRTSNRTISKKASGNEAARDRRKRPRSKAGKPAAKLGRARSPALKKAVSGKKSKPDTLEAARAAVSLVRDLAGGASETSKPVRKRETRLPPEKASDDACRNCSKDLRNEDKALFVEEELSRVFCSEECIAAHFAPEIDRLEKEYMRRLSSSDLSGEEREKLAHLRWITLEEPDEIWREKTLTGDHRYTLISEFQPGARPVWCVCICLFLRGEPSFLYLAFPTRNAAMVAQYRRGERVQWGKGRSANGDRDVEPRSQAKAPVRSGTSILNPADVRSGPTAQAMAAEGGPLMDGLADGWTEEEQRRAEVVQERRTDDIPADEFDLYEACLDETLEGPDEVWSSQQDTQDEDNAEEGFRLYHFIRRYRDENPHVWYLIVARETENSEEIEILDAFPTRDPQLVERYRRGKQEIGGEERSASRLVH